jgi:hypothetical protein
MNKQSQNFKLCKTVGALIKELEKLPKRAKLDNPKRPVYYNTFKGAKASGLKPCVGLEEY